MQRRAVTPSSCGDAAGCAAEGGAWASIAAALVPFAAAFGGVATLAVRRVFPRLRCDDDDDDDDMVGSGGDTLLPTHAERAARRRRRRRAEAWAFGAAVGLAATLGLLVLAEVVDAVDPAARELALGLTLPALLVVAVVVVPWLASRALVAAAGWTFTPSSSSPRAARTLRLALFAAWLLAFWAVGDAARRRAPTDADVRRKQAGLDAARDMLLSRRRRLRALASRPPPPRRTARGGGLVAKALGALRSAGDEAELRALRVDVARLEAVEASLAARLSLLRAPSRAFSAYCVYRIGATALATLRRASSSSSASASSSSADGFAGADPVTRFLGLAARHWDPTLDQAAPCWPPALAAPCARCACWRAGRRACAAPLAPSSPSARAPPPCCCAASCPATPPAASCAAP